MLVLRIFLQTVQCAQKKVLFLTSFHDFRLAGTITRTLTEGKYPISTTLQARMVPLPSKISMQLPHAKGHAKGSAHG